MNTLPTNFTFNTNTIRVVEIDGEPWFVARDVCLAVGLYLSRRVKQANVTEMARHLADDQTTFNRVETTNHIGRKQTTRVMLVSESGLYQTLMSFQSSNPAVRQFQDWVTGTVLPAIRKDGGYIAGEEKVTTGEMSEDGITYHAVSLTISE